MFVAGKQKLRRPTSNCDGDTEYIDTAACKCTPASVTKRQHSQPVVSINLDSAEQEQTSVRPYAGSILSSGELQCDKRLRLGSSKVY